MSNHYSAANLRSPGDDARLDFTDIYAFQANGGGAHRPRLTAIPGP